MSIVHRRSIIFDRPTLTSARLQIDEVLNSYKSRLLITNRSSCKIENAGVDRISLPQAKCLEMLSKTGMGRSVHSLCKAFNKNGQQNIQNVDHITIDPQKMKLFYEGVHYRSKQRAKGTGVRFPLKQDFAEYYHRLPDESQILDSKADKFSTINTTTTYSKRSRSKLSTFSSARKC